MRTRPTVDRTADRRSSEVAAASAIRRFNEVLDDALGEREKGVMRLRFGLVDGRPQTLDEIGRTFGVTRERIRQIEQKTISKLRRPDRLEALNEIREIPVGSLPAHVLQRLFDGRPPVPTIDDVQPVWCDRHRAYHGVRTGSTPRRCGWCTCLVGQPTLRGGRPRRYCSDSCKQAAYRVRRAESRSGSDTRPNDVSPPTPATP